MIFGNVDGIKKSILKKLEQIYDLKLDKVSISNLEMIEIMCEITQDINKEISVAIDRRGNVINVSVGDSNTVEMPIIDIKEKKLSGIKILHTHPNGNSMLSGLDISALITLKLDCMAAIGVESGECKDITIGFCDVEDNKLGVQITHPMKVETALNVNIMDVIRSIEENLENNDIYEDTGERAILVGIEDEESLDELEELAKACNVATLGKVLQKRSKIDNAFFIGEGKVNEVSMLRQTTNANVIIFDDELSASQIRNIENITGCKVIDRNTLILEIFATRARSKESKIQVELAQLKYRLPRLAGLGTVLSRTGAGIGTRGPGEKKLEVDKRHIRDRIHDLSNELKKIKKTRVIQREKRSKDNIPRVSLVGYTNAGKSTLRNKLCELSAPKNLIQKEKIFEADMLFATLDVTTRALVLPDNRLITLTDTVGFIRKLPHDLVEAFKSTLEEVIDSHVLLHVVDGSSKNANQQIDAVNEVLKELGAVNKPMMILLNKIDKSDREDIEKLKSEYKDIDILEISSKENINLDVLLKSIAKILPNTLKKVEYLIPYSDSASAALLHRSAKVIEEEYEGEGISIVAMVDEEVYNRCSKYIKK